MLLLSLLSLHSLLSLLSHAHKAKFVVNISKETFVGNVIAGNIVHTIPNVPTLFNVSNIGVNYQLLLWIFQDWGSWAHENMAFI